MASLSAVAYGCEPAYYALSGYFGPGCGELSGHAGLSVEVYRYGHLPVWRVISLDGTLYVSAFDAQREGHESAVYKIPMSTRGALYRGMRRMLDSEFQAGRRVV